MAGHILTNLALSLSLSVAPVGGGGGGPTTDPIVQSINANSWSITAGSTPPTMDPDNAPKFLVGLEPGFDGNANVISVPVVHTLTSRIRQSYPNHALLTADQVSLSDYPYQDGTYPGVTNNGTERSPKPVCNWAMPPSSVVGNTLNLELTAFHRNARSGQPVACVEFRATDGVTTVTQKVNASSILGYSGDQFAVVGYKTALDITSLTAGPVTANAKVYPHIGVAGVSVADSADGVDAREFSPQVFLKNATLAANPVFVYVNASTGNDATGAVSTTAATAEATPCQTMGGAVNRAIAVNGTLEGVVVRFMAGTHVLSSSAIIATRAQSTGWCTFTRDPNATKAGVILQFGTTSVRLRFGATMGYLKIAGVTFQRVGTLGFTGEAASKIRMWMDDVDFDAGNSNNNLFGTNMDGGYWTGCQFTNMPANSTSILGASSAASHRLLRGCSGDLNGATVELCNTLGCVFSRPNGLTAGTVRSPSGSITAFNRFNSPTSSTFISMGIQSDINGAAIVQNVIEFTRGSSAHVIGVSNDNGVGNNTHVILHHNTITTAFEAGRCNLFYDEGTTARTSKLMSVVGNIYVPFTKSDVFRGGNQAGADASTRTGNWAYMYGAGCRSNFTMFQSNTPLGGNAAQQYPGLRSKMGTSTTVRQDPLFTDYKGPTVAPGPVYTAGAGGGTYTLEAGSPCIGMIDNAVLAFDLAGNARSLTSSAAGAYERLAA